MDQPRLPLRSKRAAALASQHATENILTKPALLHREDLASSSKPRPKSGIGKRCGTKQQRRTKPKGLRGSTSEALLHSLLGRLEEWRMTVLAGVIYEVGRAHSTTTQTPDEARDARFIRHLSQLFLIVQECQTPEVREPLSIKDACTIAQAIPDTLSTLPVLAKLWSPKDIAHTWTLRALIAWQTYFNPRILGLSITSKRDPSSDQSDPFHMPTEVKRVHALFATVDEHLLLSARYLWRYNHFNTTFDAFLPVLELQHFTSCIYNPYGCTLQSLRRYHTTRNSPRTIGFMSEAGVMARRRALERVGAAGMPTELFDMIALMAKHDERDLGQVEAMFMLTRVLAVVPLPDDMAARHLHETYAPWPIIEMLAGCTASHCAYSHRPAPRRKAKPSLSGGTWSGMRARKRGKAKAAVPEPEEEEFAAQILTCPRRMRVRWDMRARAFESLHVVPSHTIPKAIIYKCARDVECRGHHEDSGDELVLIESGTLLVGGFLYERAVEGSGALGLGNGRPEEFSRVQRTWRGSGGAVGDVAGGVVR